MYFGLILSIIIGLIISIGIIIGLPMLFDKIGVGQSTKICEHLYNIQSHPLNFMDVLEDYEHYTIKKYNTTFISIGEKCYMCIVYDKNGQKYTLKTEMFYFGEHHIAVFGKDSKWYYIDKNNILMDENEVYRFTGKLAWD